jgi:hypothetical protein
MTDICDRPHRLLDGLMPVEFADKLNGRLTLQERKLGIRKSVQDEFLAAGDVATWLRQVEAAFRDQGFKNVRVISAIGQVDAEFKPWVGTLYGDVKVTLRQHGQQTQFNVTATANVDNVFALGASPGMRLIEKLKDGLRATCAFQEAPPAITVPKTPAVGGGVSEELARLAQLHANGLLDSEEFKAAKAKILG